MASALARVFSRTTLQKSSGLIVHSNYQRLFLLGQRCARLPQSGRCLSGYRGGREWGDRDSGGRSYGARKQTEEEDEDLYEVNEESSSGLRKQHREQALREHVVTDQVTFADFPINADLQDRLQQLGYNEPFEIQAKTLLPALSGKDVIGKAVTGSGKTLAFSIPILQKLSQSSPSESRGRTRSPRAIVISPTRELCLQLHRSIQELGRGVRCVALYGGASFYKQEKEMMRGVDVICATPGRLKDHLQRGTIDLKEVAFLCLDEADELLTPNFKDQIEDVLQGCPADKQMMLFSATMPSNIRSVVKNFMTDPVEVDITSGQRLQTPESVKHLCMKVPSSQHILVIKHLLDEYKPERCIVFMETKVKTREVAQTLRHQMGMQAEGLHSDLSQSRRENIMAAFREGQIKILVATDVAARGLDVPEISLIIQAGPPRNGCEYYIHRSGRTGRGGRDGCAILLHSGNHADMDIIHEIERSVTLQHTPVPNATELQRAAVGQLVTRLRGMSARRWEAAAETLASLALSPDDTHQLLCAAVASIVSAAPSGGEREHRGEAWGERRRVERHSHGYERRGGGGGMTGGRYGHQGGRYTPQRRGGGDGYYNSRGGGGQGGSRNDFTDGEDSDDDDIAMMHQRYKSTRSP